MSPEDQRRVRQLFDEYIELYAARDARLVDWFSEDFSGFAGSSDKLVKTRAEWVEVTLQDFAQVPGRIGIEMVDFFAQALGDGLLAATAFFHIHLPNAPDALFAGETARKVVLFRREGSAWKIAHVSVSCPTARRSTTRCFRWGSCASATASWRRWWRSAPTRSRSSTTSWSC